jgi:hypothetical protein
LRTKVNGEWVIGEVGAVVPVLGADQVDQQGTDDEGAQPISRTPPAVDRSGGLKEQRREPTTAAATEGVRRSARP